MRRLYWGWVGLGVAVALSCGGEEFATQGTGGASGGGAAGSGGAGGAVSGGGGAAAAGGTTPAGGTAGTGATAGAGGGVAGAGGAGGASGGAGGTGGAAGTGGATGGVGGATPDAGVVCPAPTAATQLGTASPNPEYPVISGAYVYFSTDTSIMRAPVAGGGATSLHTDVSPTQNEGVTVSSHNLMWADTGRGELRHLDLNNNAFTVLVTGQTAIQTVAADATHVYWAYANGIRRRATAVESLYASTGAYAIALGETEVFWVTLGGAVLKGPKAGTPEGGSAVTLATQTNPLGGNWSVVSIALDATHVYWTARLGTSAVTPDGGPPPDALWRVPRGGGTVEPVLVASGAEGIALSPSCVYVGSRGGTNGRIYVRQKSTPTPILNLGGFQYPRGLALEGTTFVFTESMGGTVNRATL